MTKDVLSHHNINYVAYIILPSIRTHALKIGVVTLQYTFQHFLLIVVCTEYTGKLHNVTGRVFQFAREW